MTGWIKHFKPEGYGHIIPEDRGHDVFFHLEQLDGVKVVRTGQLVEFELYPDYPTRRAMWVRVIDKLSYAPVGVGRRRQEAYGTD